MTFNRYSVLPNADFRPLQHFCGAEFAELFSCLHSAVCPLIHVASGCPRRLYGDLGVVPSHSTLLQFASMNPGLCRPLAGYIGRCASPSSDDDIGDALQSAGRSGGGVVVAVPQRVSTDRRDTAAVPDCRLEVCDGDGGGLLVAIDWHRRAGARINCRRRRRRFCCCKIRYFSLRH